MPPSSSMTHSRVRHYIFYANCGDISPRREEFVFDGMMAASRPSQQVRAKRGPLTGSERAGTERSDNALGHAARFGGAPRNRKSGLTVPQSNRRAVRV